jgi:hypothetical protein
VTRVLLGPNLDAPIRFSSRAPLNHIIGGRTQFWQIVRSRFRRFVTSDAECMAPQVDERPASSGIVGHNVGDEKIVIVDLPLISRIFQCPRHFIPTPQ